MTKVFFKTFGCRTNKFDTQIMMANLQNYTVTKNIQEADILIINSCTVTNSADSGVRNYINKTKRENPNIVVYFTGCGVLTQGEKLHKNQTVKSVFSSSLKEEIDSLLTLKEPFFKTREQTQIDSTIVGDIIGNQRAFIKIQEGCDFECSYCIIPYVRGASRSIKEKTITEQIQLLTDKGFSEFILTGTNTGSYGFNSSTSLAKLIHKISKISGVKRIRLGSIEPLQVTDELIDIASSDIMDKYLHIALQHTSDKMLQLMKRRNNYSDDYKLLTKLGDLGFALGTDYITGFPGEKIEDHKEAYKRLEDLPLTHIHGFSYSKRDGTESSKLKEDVPGNEARRRLKEITDLIDDKNRIFKEKNKQPLKVLIEKSEKIEQGYINSGLDQFFNRVSFCDISDFYGQWHTVENYNIS
ncbi:MAG: tRNA (N(6)-L-threonylcarbamoyladenosine(37)-C(2))-methylthiotransferase MtaB [Campylobacterales bacterium]|nr:tRNA (N(6)-L-threonylcarbamoyladenosine(37)-C(2))-methylthiotransferase MtaB [Campylobacterales bacterium]